MREVLKQVHDLWTAGRRVDLHKLLISRNDAAQIAQIGRTLALDSGLRNFFRAVGES